MFDLNIQDIGWLKGAVTSFFHCGCAMITWLNGDIYDVHVCPTHTKEGW